MRLLLICSILIAAGVCIRASIYDGREDLQDDQLLSANVRSAYYEEKAQKYELIFDPPEDKDEKYRRLLYDAAVIRLRIEESELKRIQANEDLDSTEKAKLIKEYLKGIDELDHFITNYSTTAQVNVGK